MKNDAPNNEDLKKILKQGISMQQEIILNYETFLEIIDKVGDTQLYNSVKAKKERSEGHKGTFKQRLLAISMTSKRTDPTPLSNGSKNKIETIPKPALTTTDLFELLINTPIIYYKNIDGTSVKVETTFLDDGFCHLPQRTDIPDNAKYAYDVLYQAAEWIQRVTTENKYFLINKYMYEFNECICEFIKLISLKENLSVNLKNYISQKDLSTNEFYIASVIKHILRWIYYVKFNDAIKLNMTKDELTSIKASLKSPKETQTVKKDTETKRESKIQTEKTKPKETIIIKQEDVIVLSGIRACTNNAHKVVEKNAKVLVQKDSGYAFEIVPISFCQECQRYIMLYSDFDRINGKILCRVRDIRNGNNSDDSYEQQTSYETSESIMHRYGYNVNAASNLSSQERTAILVKLINNKVLTRSQVCSHLEYLIHRNQHKKNMTAAISKWNSDLKYIRKYKPKDNSDIFIKNITIK